MGVCARNMSSLRNVNKITLLHQAGISLYFTMKTHDQTTLKSTYISVSVKIRYGMAQTYKILSTFSYTKRRYFTRNKLMENMIIFSPRSSLYWPQHLVCLFTKLRKATVKIRPTPWSTSLSFC